MEVESNFDKEVRATVAALEAIVWLIVAVLVVFWIIGFFFAHLGTLIWIALVVAAILLIYNLLTRGRAAI